MDRISGAGHVGHLFVSEDVNIPREPTEITPEWLNGVQEELVGLVESAGLVPSSASLTQVATAIKTIFQKAAAVSAAASGTVDAITANFTPAITALTDHLRLIIRAAGANTIATPTFTPASATIAPATIVKGHNQPLAPGDFSGVGFRGVLQYDAALAKWVLLNPATGVSPGRIKLSAPLTLYVSTAGSDSNTGLSAGSPFLTIQKAASVIQQSYDLAGFSATIQLADGTYTSGLAISAGVVGQNGPGTLIIKGNASTPSNVVISTTSSDCLSLASAANCTVQNLKLQTTTSGNGALVANGAYLVIGPGVVFGDCATAHVNATSGKVAVAGNYSISGGAPIHWLASDCGTIVCNGKTVTISGNPNFSISFAQAYDAAAINVGGNAFSGATTGVRYLASMNGVINVNTGGASYLPGNAAGSTATGGQYA